VRIAVKDANVFIDLESMGILDLWFQLGYQTITSSFVVVELEDGGHANSLASIQAGQVIEAVISSEEMEAFETLRVECEPTGLSSADVSVLYLAIREDALLLSGDKSLRIQAKVRWVEIHGTLWIMDQLVDSGLLAKRVAAQRLEALLRRTGKERRYLPIAECHARITRWSKG
jgi:predicted nucleic acid-binding protein